MMTRIRLITLCALLTTLHTVPQATASSYPDSDIVIVSNNDLDPSNPNRASALYLTSPTFTCAEAQTACKALDETLLPLPSDVIGLTRGNLSEALLSGLYGFSVAAGQDVWVGGTTSCSIFDPSTSALSTPANPIHTLPVLCTNSAPLTRSNSSTTDISRQMDLSTPSAGALTGYRDKFSWRFLGIKYATSTRFAPPVALSVSEGEHRNATLYGPRCAQPPDADNGHLLWTNEDCLYLNVYSPIVNTGTTPNITSPKLPVMFFIHGGGLNTGDSGPFPYNMTTSGYVGPSISNIYDGTNLVSFGYVVLVTINYRLTAFGWFNASNAALKDTLMALEWVQENIEAFGGDKSKVLVFGESAGAIMSRYLIGTNPKYTTGLFSSIILESDFSTLDPFVSPTIAQTITSLPLAKALNCTPTNSTTFTPAAAECVAALPAGDVALASYDLGISWDITIDGDYILTDIATSIEEGVYAKVPTIWASNACEYCYFLGPPAINPTNTSSALFPAYLSTILNATAVALISNATTLWPYETEPPPVRGVISGVVEELGMFVTDYAVRCPMGYLAGLMDGGVGGGGAYKVEFGIGLGSPLTPNPAVCVGQVCHADELYFVFATAETDNLYQPLTTTQLDTTREVIKRWASLARSGTPNYWGAQVVWQPYTMGGGAGENVVVIGSGGIQNGGAYRAAQCEFIVSQLGLVFGYD